MRSAESPHAALEVADRERLMHAVHQRTTKSSAGPQGFARAERRGGVHPMGLPQFVTIKEVGPREGMQFEKGPIPTADKIRLVDMLSDCNFRQIEVTSFVSPKWV